MLKKLLATFPYYENVKLIYERKTLFICLFIYFRLIHALLYLVFINTNTVDIFIVSVFFIFILSFSNLLCAFFISFWKYFIYI